MVGVKKTATRRKTKLLGDARKFELTNETKAFYGTTLVRIRATKNFMSPVGKVKAGDIGGFVEHEDNLDHAGTCWIDKDGKCYDDAIVTGAAVVTDAARVFNGARLMGRAIAKGRGALGGPVVVGGHAVVTEPAMAA